jgi:hypothetical protein
VSTQAARPPDTLRADRHVNTLLTSGLAVACYYAADRPDCQVLATIRHGQIALCARCDQRRSTTGKGTPPDRLPDPHALRDAVTCARQAGHLWSTAAAIPGVTRQAALRPAHHVRKIS